MSTGTAAHFATALGQALATLALYHPDHPARDRARERLRASFVHAADDRGGIRLSFMPHDVISWTAAVPELRGWEWSTKLTRAGIGRIEIDTEPRLTDEGLDRFLEALHERVSASSDRAFTPYAWGPFRIGPLGIIDPREDDDHALDLVDALAATSLAAEGECVHWIHDQVLHTDAVPMAEVEAVVHGLAVAMQHDQHMVLPLLEIKTQDQYTSTHSCNVAMLAMGLAEEVGLSSSDVRAIGTAALLHDIGKVRVSLEVLVKPGKLTDDEYAEMKRHTVEGARILSRKGRGHALAAIVAYEHHVWENGLGGYPTFHYDRACHYASRLVHVCDLYDALGTDRPYRRAWPRQRIVDMLRAQSGVEVDGELVEAFIRLLTRSGERRATLPEAHHNDWNAALARTAAQYAGPMTASTTAAPASATP